ncbi:hypothetical protein D3C71_2023160 [compost metagenome]
MAGAEKNRAANPQNVFIAVAYMLHPWLRGALEVKKQRRQHPCINRRLQFQQQRGNASQAHHHELGATDPQ